MEQDKMEETEERKELKEITDKDKEEKERPEEENGQLKKETDEVREALEEKTRTEEERARKGEERREENAQEILRILELEHQLRTEQKQKEELNDKLRLEMEEKERERKSKEEERGRREHAEAKILTMQQERSAEKTRMEEKLTKMEVEKTGFHERAIHYQKLAHEEKTKNEELTNEVKTQNENIEGLTNQVKEQNEENKKLKKFQKLCVDILTGENVDKDAVIEFTEMAAVNNLQMHVAVSLGEVWLLEHVKKNKSYLLKTKNKRGWTPFRLATARGDTLFMQLLWQRDDLQRDGHLLHVAAANRWYNAAKFLKKKRADKNAIFKGHKACQVARLVDHKPLARDIEPRRWFYCIDKGPKDYELVEEQIDELLLHPPRRGPDGEHSDTNSNTNDFTGAPARPPPPPPPLQPSATGDIQPSYSTSEGVESRLKDPDMKRARERGDGAEKEGTYRKSRRGEDHETKPVPEERRGQPAPFQTPPEAHHEERMEALRRRVKPDEVRLPRGLPNLRNTCYMNSVMQCLYHTTPLAVELRDLEGDTRQGSVVNATVRVKAALDRGGNPREDAMRQLKRIAGQRDAVYKDFQQKEAHDFLCQMLEWLHQDMARLQEGGSAEDEEAESFITKIFHGTHLSTVTCEKEPKTPVCTTTETFSNLSLTIIEPTELEDALKQYYRPQQLVWDCPRCRREHMCQHKTSLTQSPHVLILHLNRSTLPEISRHKVKVLYPEFQDVKLNNGETRRYKLFAVCCHDGSMSSGHYTAYCRRGDQWYCFDDTIVSKSKSDYVFDRNSAHILFYQVEESQELSTLSL